MYDCLIGFLIYVCCVILGMCIFVLGYVSVDYIIHRNDHTIVIHTDNMMYVPNPIERPTHIRCVQHWHNVCPVK